MSNISKISNIPINNTAKIYEINKSNIAEINGMSLTAPIDSYTKLLMSMEGNSSDEVHDLKLKGNIKFVSDEKKFGNYSSYANSSNDFISIPDSDDWYLGTEDFTIECWIRPINTTTIPIYGQLKNGTSNQNRIMLGYWSGAWNFYVRASSDPIIYISVSDTVIANEWIHIAITRSGNNFRLFKNGIQLGTTQTNSNAIPNNTGLAYIGAINYYSTWPVTFRGNMDEFRFSKGIARWTSNFTPPTSQYTTDSYTKLLIHFDIDRGLSGHSVTSYGEMEIRNSKKKMGDSSMYFNGSSYLMLPDSEDWSFGSEDFTIDFWYNFIEDRFSHFVGQYTMGYNVNNSWSAAYDYSTHKLRFEYSTTGSDYHSILSDVWTPVLDTWYHIAYVRNNNTFTFYVDGQAKGSYTFNASIADSSKSFFIGRNDYNFTTGGYWMLKGYMDELRISKGVARWTSNFTPPTSEY